MSNFLTLEKLLKKNKKIQTELDSKKYDKIIRQGVAEDELETALQDAVKNFDRGKLSKEDFKKVISDVDNKYINESKKYASDENLKKEYNNLIEEMQKNEEKISELRTNPNVEQYYKLIQEESDKPIIKDVPEKIKNISILNKYPKIKNTPFFTENSGEIKNTLISNLKNSTEQEVVDRLNRAKNMGFNTDKVFFHGTRTKFDEKNPGFIPVEAGTFFSPDPEFTENFSTSKGSTIPTFLKVKNTFDFQNDDHINTLKNEFKKINGFDLSEDTIEEIKDGNWVTIEDPDVQRSIKKSGFDSYHVQESGRKNIAVYEPKNIRSIFAKFDPTKSESEDLAAFTQTKKPNLLGKAFGAADIYGAASDIAQNRPASAAVSAAEYVAPKLGAVAGRVAPFLDLLRPTEMMTEDQTAEDEMRRPEQYRSFKKLKKLFEEN